MGAWRAQWVGGEVGEQLMVVMVVMIKMIKKKRRR